MEIVVTSVKVLKKGANDYGEWKLVKVITNEGVEYTTLAKEADTITPNSTINITDMDEDERGKKFKKYEVVTAAPQHEAKPVKYGESDTKTRSMAIAYAKDLAVAKLIGIEDMKRWAKYFVDYIGGKDEKVSTIFPETENTVEDVAEEKIPKDAGELMTWVASHGKGYNTKWFAGYFEVLVPGDIKNIKLAYDKLKHDMNW